MNLNTSGDDRERVQLYVDATANTTVYNPSAALIKTSRIKTPFSMKHSHRPRPHWHTLIGHILEVGRVRTRLVKQKHTVPRSPISKSTPYIPGFKQLLLLLLFCCFFSSFFARKVFRGRLQSSYIHKGGFATVQSTGCCWGLDLL